MKISAIFALLGVVCSIDNVSPLRDYVVRLRSSKVEYIRNDTFKVHDYAIKKLNRTYTVLNLETTILQDLDELLVHVQIFQYISNNYQPSLMDKIFDICYLLKNINAIPHLKMVSNVIYKYGNFPRECPFTKGNYYLKNLHVNEDYLPAFLIPPGKWKFRTAYQNKAKNIYLTTHVIAEIIPVVSRKHQIT